MSEKDIPQSKIESVISLFSNNKLQEALDNSLTLLEDFPNDALLQTLSVLAMQAWEIFPLQLLVIKKQSLFSLIMLKLTITLVQLYMNWTSLMNQLKAIKIP